MAKDKKNRLGTGLNELLPTGGKTELFPSGGKDELSGEKTTITNNGQPLLVKISDIEKNPYQPRKYFNKEEISKLAESIRSKGIIEPLVAIKNKDIYQLIAGHRRLMAAKEAKLDKVPVIIHESVGPVDNLELALVENMLRQNLNPIEEAEAFSRLATEFSKTSSSIAEVVKKDRSTVENTIRLLRLPDEVKTEIQLGRLTAGHGKALLGLESKKDLLIKTKNDILSNKLTVRQTEALVKKLLKEKKDTKIDLTETNEAETIKTYYEYISNEISKSLGGLKVTFKYSGKNKKIEINYNNVDDLDILLKKIGVTIEQ